ncbi:MAG: heavy-metal-associated domain-containing protein [Candidatus Gracilibacteria bacterium]
MKTTIFVPGIHCNSCVTMIKEISGDFPSILSVDVDMGSKKVSLEHTEDFDFDAWSHEIEALGAEYTVKKIS